MEGEKIQFFLGVSISVLKQQLEILMKAGFTRVDLVVIEVPYNNKTYISFVPSDMYNSGTQSQPLDKIISLDIQKLISEGKQIDEVMKSMIEDTKNKIKALKEEVEKLKEPSLTQKQKEEKEYQYVKNFLIKLSMIVN